MDRDHKMLLAGMLIGIVVTMILLWAFSRIQ